MNKRMHSARLLPLFVTDDEVRVGGLGGLGNIFKDFPKNNYSYRACSQSR